MLEHFGQCALPEGHMGLLLGRCRYSEKRIRLGLAADTVLEHRETHVDLARLSHTLWAVLSDVTRGLGACKVDEVQQTILGPGDLWVLDADPADGVGP